MIYLANPNLPNLAALHHLFLKNALSQLNGSRFGWDQANSPHV